MAVSDYIGRTVDLSAYSDDGVFNRTKMLADLARPGEGGEVCTGIRKLMQRFIINLFTIKGSVLHEPSRGCEFLTLIARGHLRTPPDVSMAFASAVTNIQPYMEAEDLASDPDDERLASVELLNASVSSNGEIEISVRIESQSGTSAVYIFPIKATVA